MLTGPPQTGRDSARAPRPLKEPWSLKPVQIWAFIGALFLAIGSYSWSRWLLGGHAKPVTTGRDEVPDWMAIGLHLQEGVLLIGAILTVYFFIYRGWRREGRLTFDGMFVIAFFTCWCVQDPWMNYGQPMFSYNSELINLGCPQCFAPGWMGHTQTFAEPLSWGLLYLAFVPFFILCAKIADWGLQRWGSQAKAYLLIFVGGMVFELITDTWCLLWGFYQYGGAHAGWTLFHGERYQMPLLTDYIAAGLCYMTLNYLRYKRDDKGQTMVERGLDRVKTTSKGRQGIRFLAIVGLCQTAVFGYNLVMSFESMHPSTWPQDITDRPYFTQQICGKGTTYACPTSDLPMVGPGDAHFTPGGQLVPGENGSPARLTSGG